jgi:hypothetical protein
MAGLAQRADDMLCGLNIVFDQEDLHLRLGLSDIGSHA